MSPKDISGFYQWLRPRLAGKGYTELAPIEPLQLGFFKHGALSLPYVVAVKDATYTTDSPTKIFQRVEGWFQTLIGRTGAGLLLFVCHQPLATTVEEIEKIGGQVVAGAYDLFTGRDRVPEHLGWRQEIFG